jgi:hypothetical protein
MTSERRSFASKTIAGNPLATQNTPPPSVTLPYFAASFLGLIAFGIELWRASSQAVADPTSDPTVAAAHLAMLATLSMGIIGALHQFTPVVTGRKLKSILIARLTFITWLLGSWLLPIGFASGNETFVIVGGVFTGISVVLLTFNLWNPLSVRGKGAPVIGLRLALAGLIATGCFGLVYVGDRSGNWFTLSGHTVLAHAIIGIFAWLGLAYISVSGRLWPMFFLAHLPKKNNAGLISVTVTPAGVILLSAGLLLSVHLVAFFGAVLAGAGLAFHLRSQELHLRNRKRKIDLYLIQVVTASFWLGIGTVLAVFSELKIDSNYRLSTGLAAASIACFTGWVLVAYVAHVHKVIPFILWSTYRNHRITKNSTGGQLLFADFYSQIFAVVVFILINMGLIAIVLGFSTRTPQLLALSGLLFAIAGISLLGNFTIKPLQIYRDSKLQPVL